MALARHCAGFDRRVECTGTSRQRVLRRWGELFAVGFDTTTVRDELDADRSADETTVSVVAHGLLRSVTVVQGGVETLLLRWRALDERARDEILRAVLEHAVLIGGSLQDLMHDKTSDVPSTEVVEPWLRANRTRGAVGTDEGHAEPAASRRTNPTYALCPRCRYRGVYVVVGRNLIRCRYCRAVANLAPNECDEAALHPEEFTTRLGRRR
jgi:hypothetical protein